jgi:hypothetical protein
LKRTQADLEAAFGLLEQQGAAYLAESMNSGGQTIVALRPHAEPGARRRPHRRTAGLAVAAAVLAAAVSVSVASLRGTSEARNQAGSANAIPVCMSRLPSSWGTALRAHPIRVAGQNLSIVAVDGQGDVIVQWTVAGRSLRIGRVTGDAVEQIARVALRADQAVARVAVDAHSVVVELMPRPEDGAQRVNVEDIVLIDRHTGRVTHLLPSAPIPPGYVSAAGPGSWAVLQDGVYYWLEGPDQDNAPQTLLSYDTATKAYAARATQQAAVYWSPLGISWDGGSIPAGGLPPVLPPTEQHKQTLAYDGASVAWSTYDRPSLVHWSDRTGHTRVLEQKVMSQLAIEAVSGPYILLTSGEGDDHDKVNGNVQILDTRTGALADTGINGSLEPGPSGPGVLAFWPVPPSATAQLLYTRGLPGLTCQH